MIENLQEMPEVQKIIALGKANREVSYDEINEILPDKILNSEKIDDVFTLLHELGIEVVEDYTKEAVEEAIQQQAVAAPPKPEKLKEIKGFPEEQALLLKHMIVSHHGSREFGSPEPPKTIEAVLLNYLDEIDSKINGIREFMSSEDPTATWTSYHRLLERHFYKGKT